MPGEYVEERDGDFYVAGSRVSLASIIHEFRDGASPETIRRISHRSHWRRYTEASHFI
jgi:hypothetical protein